MAHILAVLCGDSAGGRVLIMLMGMCCQGCVVSVSIDDDPVHVVLSQRKPGSHSEVFVDLLEKLTVVVSATVRMVKWLVAVRECAVCAYLHVIVCVASC